eukprot:TRINITY_DN7990_c0_g1_i11.p1 TRINITY_DN7990_c0_g1~~TRINITY_DN7990_c0_g1_i11.p1  ORF type:complete len:350 (+),score=40.21 TRINITY_DN7990_c0_g1_i11:1015-2064(+)
MNQVRSSTSKFISEFRVPHYTETKRKQRGYWHNKNSQREFLSELANKLGYTQWEDWYSISSTDIIKTGGWGLLKVFEGSPTKALTTVFPEYDWKIQRFKYVPLNFWKQRNNQRELMDEIGRQLGFKEWEDWYQVTSKQISELGGKTILNQYGCSPSKLVTSIYPEREWKIHQFHFVPIRHWSDPTFTNHKELLKSIGEQLQVKSLKDWYQVKTRDTIRLGGSGMLYQFGNSLPKALMAVYGDEFDWKKWNFQRVSTDFWGNLENQRDFLAHIARSQNITKSADWRKVSAVMITKKGGAGLLKQHHGSISKALQTAFADSFTEPSVSLEKISKPQREIMQLLRNLTKLTM